MSSFGRGLRTLKSAKHLMLCVEFADLNSQLKRDRPSLTLVIESLSRTGETCYHGREGHAITNEREQVLHENESLSDSRQSKAIRTHQRAFFRQQKVQHALNAEN